MDKVDVRSPITMSEYLQIFDIELTELDVRLDIKFKEG